MNGRTPHSLFVVCVVDADPEPRGGWATAGASLHLQNSNFQKRGLHLRLAKKVCERSSTSKGQEPLGKLKKSNNTPQDTLM